jgi:1,4-alpha-glucan branching enzyme
MTPQVHHGYQLRLPHGGRWREILNSDAASYGGSGIGNMGEVTAKHGIAEITLPPLATIMFEWQG